MAKVVCKGTVLEYDASGSPVAVGQIISMSHDGAEADTWEDTTLDSGPSRTHQGTGYSEPGSFTFEVFLDPVLANHIALQALLTTPAEQDWQITFADSGTTTQRFDSVGITFGFSVDMADGLKADITLKLKDLMVYNT